MVLRWDSDTDFDVSFPVVVVGAGACGLTAAVAAHGAGAEVLVLERDATPSGSTALSSGFIPACATRWQRDAGVEDSVEHMAADIQAKADYQADPVIVDLCCSQSGPTLEWLADTHRIPFVLVEGFLYAGQTRLRMHATPERTGASLINRLISVAGRAGVEILTAAHVVDLYADESGRVRGLRYERPHRTQEIVGCEALVLACNGFGGNCEMIRRHIPEMSEALYFGHDGNQGDAARWGGALGGVLRHMGAYQGHASVATPHGVLVTWAVIMEGGIQVNADGRRFADENRGYSEPAVDLLRQPGGIAWDIYDARIHTLAQEFADYRQAEAAGAIKRAETTEDLADLTGLPRAALAETLAQVEAYASGEANDTLGRDFTGKPALVPPYYAVKVTGALFHTQGGLVIDSEARVITADGAPLPNLFAGGGAACGISGPSAAGYSSGNGLLTAVVLGRVAGEQAARLVS